MPELVTVPDHDTLSHELVRAGGAALVNPASAPGLLILSDPMNWIRNGCGSPPTSAFLVRKAQRIDPLKDMSFHVEEWSEDGQTLQALLSACDLSSGASSRQIRLGSKGEVISTPMWGMTR